MRRKCSRLGTSIDTSRPALNLGSGPEGLEFEYDEENRLTAVRRGSNHSLLMTIGYDALGRRVETVEHWNPVNNAAFATPKHVRHVYDGLQTIEEHVCDNGVTEGECDSPGWALARAFVWGDSSRFPEPVAMIDYTDLGAEEAGEAEAFHYLHDALGSVIGLTDADGLLVERYTYDPYGRTTIERRNVEGYAANGCEPIYGGGGAITPAYSAFGNPFAWTGQRFDAAVGLYHFHFRTNSPTLGRWLQRDPIEYMDGVNLYQYVVSSPIEFVDPEGLIPRKGGFLGSWKIVWPKVRAKLKAIIDIEFGGRLSEGDKGDMADRATDEMTEAEFEKLKDIADRKEKAEEKLGRKKLTDDERKKIEKEIEDLNKEAEQIGRDIENRLRKKAEADKRLKELIERINEARKRIQKEEEDRKKREEEAKAKKKSDPIVWPNGC